MNISSAQNSYNPYQTNNSSNIRETKENPTESSEIKKDASQKAITELSASERQELAGLQQRDSEVRAHEAAHIAAGGSAVSGAASFSYEKGPDGQLYAVGGEVPISVGGGNTPEEKIANAKSVQAGALAPASPSPQDLKVASSAAQIEAQARSELSQEKSEEIKEKAKEAYAQNSSDEVDLSKDTNSFDLSA